MIVNCDERTCRAQFVLTPADLARLTAKGWRIPRRCMLHRAARRPLRGGRYHVYGGEHQQHAE